MELLALDFDGVISDSAPECLAVACATWRGLEPSRELPALPPDALAEAFLALMPLGNRAEDFGITLQILTQGARVETQEAYDTFRKTLPEAWLRAFHERFYQERARRAERDRDAWLETMRPYPAMQEALPRLAERVELAIATAKDRRTVRILLEAYGLGELFPETRVFDKETGANKARHMERLSGTLGIPFAEITFVDDKVNHLDAVARLGVGGVLAAWGYNGAREHALARERGYAVCDPEALEALVSGQAKGTSG